MTTRRPRSPSPDETLKTTPVRPTGTVMDMGLAERVATEHVAETNKDIAYYQGEIYETLQSIGYTSDFAQDAVRFYTLAYNHCGNLLIAREKINQYCTLRLEGETHDVVCQKILASLPKQDVMAEPVADVDSTIVEPEQGFDAFDRRWHDQPRLATPVVSPVVATRDDIAALLPAAVASMRPVPAPTAPTAPIEAVIQHLSMGVDASRADTVLEANVRGDIAFSQALTEQRLACRRILITEGYSPEIAEEGSVYYSEKLKTFAIPARSMQETRVYCQQRKLGASITDATLAAQGKLIGIPAHDDAMDANLERAMVENRERGGIRNKILMVVGVGVLLAGVIGGAYYVGAHRGETPVETPPAAQP